MQHNVNFCVQAAVRQSGVEGSECGGGGGSLAEEELRSPRKPLLHLTHAMLGVSLPPSELFQSIFRPFVGGFQLVKEKVHLFPHLIVFVLFPFFFGEAFKGGDGEEKVHSFK